MRQTKRCWIDSSSYGNEERLEKRENMKTRKLWLQVIDLSIMMIVMIVTAVVFPGVDSVKLGSSDILLKIVVFIAILFTARCCFRMYSKVWRYANAKAYLQVMLADGLSCCLYLVVGRLVPKLNPGIAFIVISACLIILLTLLSRFIYQQMHAHLNARKEQPAGMQNKINIAIIGAGNVGCALAEELLRNPRSRYYPYCFVDKDASKAGNRIRGIRIFAENAHTNELLKSLPVHEIVIAIPDASVEVKAALYDRYHATGCPVKIYDYLGSESSLSERRTLRDFNIEDLLFRNSIKLENELTAHFYTGKTVLVTGGGGSIGSELCRQIAKQNPKKLAILDIYENNAYEIEQELRRKYDNRLNLQTIIASVRDIKRMEQVFADVEPEIVIHAAAHKHVPLMESNPDEAIKNNVMGTYHIANMAEKYGAQKFLLISTDKAVNPTNIMGASKRLCEMIIQCRVGSKTEFAAVRFGNVLGSNGSVIPLFKKQIENGGPVTVTDKRVVRYFMTIPEAVQLVLEAGAMARNGELFVLDMGKPVRIIDLAENMIRLSGLIPYQDIDIKEIGLRPGEKLYEELLMDNEELDRTDNELIFIERDKAYSRSEVEEKLDILNRSVQGSREDVFMAFRQTVPTYHAPNWEEPSICVHESVKQ